MADYRSVDDKWQETESQFSDFVDHRQPDGKWPNLIARRGTIEIPTEIAQYAKGVQVMSPNVEWALSQYVTIETQNPSKLDAICQEEGVRAKEDVEDNRIYLASVLRDMNQGNHARRAAFRNMASLGLHVERVLYRMPEEGDYAADPEKEATVYLKERDEYFKEKGGNCFARIQVPVTSVRWGPLQDHKWIIERSTIPIMEAHKLLDDKGRRVMMESDLESLYLVDAHQPLPEYTNTSEYRSKKVEFTRYEYEDPKDKKWKVCEWVSLEGDEPDAAVRLKEDIIPSGMSSYFITFSGHANLAETSDPHLLARPWAYPLMVTTFQLNYWNTYLAALTHMQTSLGLMYIKLPDTMKPEWANALEEMGLIEGAGAQRRLVVMKSDPGAGEWMISPELTRLPLETPDAIMQSISLLLQDAEIHMPNRWLTGSAFAEVREGTGTANVDQAQRASSVIGPDLEMLDHTDERICEFIRNFIIAMDADTPEGMPEKPYYIVTDGDLPIFGPQPEPGTVVMTSASKMKRKMTFRMFTKGTSAQEQREEEMAAYDKYLKRLITSEDLLRVMGEPDPTKAMEKLDKEEMREEFALRYRPIRKLNMDVFFSAQSGVDLSLLPLPMGEGEQGAQPPPSNPPPNPTIVPPPSRLAAGPGGTVV